MGQISLILLLPCTSDRQGMFTDVISLELCVQVQASTMAVVHFTGISRQGNEDNLGPSVYCTECNEVI